MAVASPSQLHFAIEHDDVIIHKYVFQSSEKNLKGTMAGAPPSYNTLFAPPAPPPSSQPPPGYVDFMPQSTGSTGVFSLPSYPKFR